MNKKIITVFIICLIIIVFISLYFFLNNRKNSDNYYNSSIKEEKYLVVYFSAQNHTKNVANKIAKNLNADTFEIIPKEKYTSDDLDWTNENSRVSKEHNDKSLRNIELETIKIDNFYSYDVVLIGYPIWWGEAAWPINTFVKNTDFTGKKVIPFCTSASSGIGNSDKILEKLTKSGTWKKGKRFSSNPSLKDIKLFTDEIKSN